MQGQIPPELEELLSGVLDVKVKVWLEWDGAYILGKGMNLLLEEIKNTSSLKQAASRAKYSYKYAWNLLQRIKDRTGYPAVVTKKGGKGGGGTVELTPWGEKLLSINEVLVSEKVEFEKRLRAALSRVTAPA
ncbi:MAG: winged helix-turn-helix domain-containing protein [Promethearchaeota archaeon]